MFVIVNKSIDFNCFEIDYKNIMVAIIELNYKFKVIIDIIMEEN